MTRNTRKPLIRQLTVIVKIDTVRGFGDFLYALDNVYHDMMLNKKENKVRIKYGNYRFKIEKIKPEKNEEWDEEWDAT